MSHATSLVETYERCAKPLLARLLQLLKIDRVYTRAEGDTLTDAEGQTVTDFLGGYGSTLLGHNHPRLVQALVDAYLRQVPTHVQGSVRGPAALLAQRLNDLLRGSLPECPDYLVHLSSTGAEAVEAAIKHALMEFAERRNRWATSVEKAWLNAAERLPDASSTQAQRDALTQVASTTPVLLAVKRSYHGKTMGALSATSNPSFKTMLGRDPIETHFLDPDDLAQCDSVVARLTLGELLPGGEQASAIAGVIFEPMQSEGGVFMLPDAFVRWLARLRERLGVPLIADEIQSGCWRTGTFLLCEQLGITPDYVLLGKSLGGGLAKISATCIASNRYVSDFSWIHSSTFAEDEPSSIVALAFCDEIQALTPSIAERADAFELALRAEVAALQAEFGPIVADVRGRGFLIGLEFDLAGEQVEIPRFLKAGTDAGIGAYLLMSYLLAQHSVRVGVTLSRPTVLRIEPSALISSAAVGELAEALREMCRLIATRRMTALTSHLWHEALPSDALDLVSPPLARAHASRDIRRVAFLTHVIDVENVGNIDPLLRQLSRAERRRFIDLFGEFADPITYHEQVVEAADGSRILLEIHGIMRMTEFFEQSLRAGTIDALEEVRHAVRIAQRRGTALAGLGQYTSIVTDNGHLVSNHGMGITTGNSLTAAFAFGTLERALRDRGRRLEECRVGVVGAAGNICNVLAQLVGDRARELVLLHRDGAASRQRMDLALERILTNCAIAPRDVRMSSSTMDLRDCDAIVLGTNTTDHLLTPEVLAADAVVVDISVPSNVDPRVLQERPDVAAFHGALAMLPNDQAIETDWMPLPEGQVYACLAETITLGLTGHEGHYSLGALRKEQVTDIMSRAAIAGVRMGLPVPLKTRRRVVMDRA